MKPRSILLLAGEASGDYHAAALVHDLKELRPDIRIVGIGGDRLAEAGMELLHHYREINTIGLGEGISKIRNILAAYSTMKSELTRGGHHLFIPVDFPDVNLRLCRIARNVGVRVCYYISPQIWAWRKGRIRKIAARVDRMMTIFPFEETLYRKAGVKADFVGHTMVRDILPSSDKGTVKAELDLGPSRHSVALVPGSRPAEILRLLPVMCEGARIYQKSFPGTQFVLPLAGNHLGSLVHTILARYDLKVSVVPSQAARVMAACDSGLVTSGTATLQAALAGMPHVVVYKLDRLTWFFAMKVLKPLVVERDIHVAMANVLSIHMEKEGGGPIKEMLDAGYEVSCAECGRPLFVPELLQDHATPETLAQWLVRFETDERLREAMARGFAQVRTMLTPRREESTPARVVLECLEGI